MAEISKMKLTKDAGKLKAGRIIAVTSREQYDYWKGKGAELEAGQKEPAPIEPEPVNQPGTLSTKALQPPPKK